MKKVIRVTVFDEDCNYGIPKSPKEFMKFWQDRIDMIPSEFMESANIEVDADPYYDSANLNVRVSYTRSETDDEEKLRIKREKDRQKFIENQELCQLEMLKEKYGL